MKIAKPDQGLLYWFAVEKKLLISITITGLIYNIGMVIVIFMKSPGLGLILCIVLPLLYAFTRFVQKRILTAHSENRKATADAAGILPETSACIRSIHVYNAEDFAKNRYDHVIARSFEAIEKTNLYDAFYSPVILTCSSAVIAVMMGLAAQQGRYLDLFGIGVGTAVTVINYVNKIFTPLDSIGKEIQTIQSAMAGIGRIRAFLNMPEMTEPTPAHSKDVISLNNVTFSYDGKKNILFHYSRDIHKGEHAVLMGRTGAGKSTIFRLVLGLYEPQEGTVTLNGTNPRTISDKEKRSVFACVEQQFHAVPGTVKDQITIGNTDITDEACTKALTLTGLQELIPHLHEPYRENLLSHGQNQLLSIARAIVTDPGILLLDEMTAGLDARTEQQIMEALDRASEGRTVLSISHRLNTADTHQRIIHLV